MRNDDPRMPPDYRHRRDNPDLRLALVISFGAATVVSTVP